MSKRWSRRVALGLVMGACLTRGALAQTGAVVQVEADPLEGFRHLPQTHADTPPTPLTMNDERRVLEAVFARFPNIDQTAMMAYIRERLPAELQEFSLASMQNLGDAMAMLSGLVRDALELQELEKHDPDLYAMRLRLRELEQRGRTLGDAARRATDAQRADRLAALQQVVEQAFEVKQAVMRRELSYLQRQITEMEALVERREENRAAIIEQRVRVVAGDVDPAQW